MLSDFTYVRVIYLKLMSASLKSMVSVYATEEVVAHFEIINDQNTKIINFGLIFLKNSAYP